MSTDVKKSRTAEYGEKPYSYELCANESATIRLQIFRAIKFCVGHFWPAPLINLTPATATEYHISYYES